MHTALRFVALACLAFLTWFTSSKLIKMGKIRGFIAGPPPQSKTITAKAILEGNYGEVYWLAWDRADIRVPGGNRINLPREVWDKHAIGDRISVYYFPGDKWPYLREGIYASNENFGFDAVFLGAELAGIGALVVYQLRSFRRRRGSLPPPLPKAA